MKKEVTINADQRLYVIPEGGGYSCLGFDVCVDRCVRLANELNQPGLIPDVAEVGTLAAYEKYRLLVGMAHNTHTATQGRWRSSSELTPQLVGLEGCRVEVVDRYGDVRRFWVGKSTGWIPCHLEISCHNSAGGSAVTGAPFQSVRVLDRGPR